jgi:hypothetical protein
MNNFFLVDENLDLSILLAHVDYHGCLVIARLVCELGAKDWLSQPGI